MRILVTGSSGQIGTNLALRLLKDGHEVFGVDKRPNAWVGDAWETRPLYQNPGFFAPSATGATAAS